MSFISKIFGGGNALGKYQSELDQVNGFKDEVSKLSQEQLREEISNFKSQFLKVEGKDEIKKLLTEIRPRVFALVREAATRTIRQTHFDVQIVGGLALTDNR